MNPLQKNKVDIKSLSPEEQRLFRMYGKLPSRSDHFAKHLKERKYFDSGDYALSKAGKADSVDTGSVGSEHPQPENIPHRESVAGSNAATAVAGAVGVAAAGAPTAGAVTQLKHAGINGVTPVAAASPAKEASFLNRETKPEADGEQQDQDTEKEIEQNEENSSSAPAATDPTEGLSQELPIRR
ncbi:uncharacterized protein BROUX77_000571 [Berkeleyomyces rouxiae]|uniref:uncharacterized protein n=1 Tax=Berkeleyomyces rouxiae TaxID=2035830 RepID=UPI003B767D8C